MPKFKTDFNPEEVPDMPKDDVYVCTLGGLEITPEPSEKGYYMAVIRNQITEGLFEGETIWDRIIVRHVRGEQIPLVARRRLKKFVAATGGKIVETPQGIGVDIPDNARYGVENRNDNYGPKANDYFTLEEMGSKQRGAASKDFKETVAETKKPEPKPEPEVSFEEFE